MKNLFIHQRKNIRVAWRTQVTMRVLRDMRALQAVTRNLSAHGALLFCDEKLEVGTPVQLILDLKAVAGDSNDLLDPVEITGKVARSNIDNTLAVTFDDTATVEKKKIRTAVVRKSLLLMERISEFPAFAELTELDQMTLTTVCHEVRLSAGEELVRLGDEATSLFLVKSGRVQIMSPDHGKDDRRKVEVAHTGQVFGEVSALLDLPHNLDIVAETDTELLAIPRESMIHLREINPNLALSLYEIFAAFMGRRLRRLTVRMFSPLNC